MFIYKHKIQCLCGIKIEYTQQSQRHMKLFKLPEFSFNVGSV